MSRHAATALKLEQVLGVAPALAFFADQIGYRYLYAVSDTHVGLPTMYSVYCSGVSGALKM